MEREDSSALDSSFGSIVLDYLHLPLVIQLSAFQIKVLILKETANNGGQLHPPPGTCGLEQTRNAAHGPD
jgi:hypothetical protein